jgi:hypothetical protein
LLPFGCVWCLARRGSTPSRSRRRFQVSPPLSDPLLRRPQHRRLDAARAHTRPAFSDRTRPLASRTWRCWITAGNDIASGSASSLTDAGPRLNRSTNDPPGRVCQRLEDTIERDTSLKHIPKYHAGETGRNNWFPGAQAPELARGLAMTARHRMDANY